MHLLCNVITTVKYMYKLGFLRAVSFQQCFLEYRCQWLDLSGLFCSIAHSLEQLLADQSSCVLRICIDQSARWVSALFTSLLHFLDPRSRCSERWEVKELL